MLEKEKTHLKEVMVAELFECRYCASGVRCTYCAMRSQFDAEYAEVGQDIGLDVWRLERENEEVRSCQYVRVPKSLHGTFFQGGMLFDLEHFRRRILENTGSQRSLLVRVESIQRGQLSRCSSGDDACKSTEVCLEGKREGGNQKRKSQMISSDYFKNTGMKYMEGKHAGEYQGTDTISPKDYKRLFRVTQRQETICLYEVEPKVEIH